MKEKVYKLLYCSQNLLGGTPEDQADQIRLILAASRSNNMRDGITGALIFNGECFAQVLEGPVAAIEATFERIQQDHRHSDATVLESGFVVARDFPEWSMAFAGASSTEIVQFAEFTMQQAIASPSAAALQVHAMLKNLVVREEEWATA